MILTARDTLFLLGVGGLAAVLVVLGWVLRARVRALLTPREWRVLGKLAAIVLFLFLLMLTQIVRELPAGLFLYGRF